MVLAAAMYPSWAVGKLSAIAASVLLSQSVAGSLSPPCHSCNSLEQPPPLMHVCSRKKA